MLYKFVCRYSELALKRGGQNIYSIGPAPKSRLGQMVMSRFWTLLFLVAACVLSFVGSESYPKGSDPINSCFCQLEGVLEDCPCEAATVDVFNQKLRHQLSPLLHHPYFRYFQVFSIIPSAGASSYSIFPGRFLPALRLLVWG